METIRLNNGIEMPIVGYGVFQVENEITARCVKDALQVGYRLIDTAQAYFNEQGVGQGIKQSGINRHDLFITTKVWVSNAGESKAAKSIDESLKKLGTDYIDLLLVHQCFSDYYGTWRAMEKALQSGKVRAIGVSNFSQGRFEDLKEFNNIVPAINQLQTNVYSAQIKQQEFLNKYDTKIMAWAPLAQGRNDISTNEILREIASRFGKTPSQIALRWLVQRGIIVIPKSTHIERMKQNFDIFDFNLTQEDMERIATLNETDNGTIDFEDPSFVHFFKKYNA